jgi:hypothetical protein
MELPLAEIQKDLKYGQDALRHLPEVEKALGSP